MSFNWKKLIGGVAPVLASVVGGPAGPFLGMGVKLITEALDLPEGCTEKEIEKAIKSDPEAYLKLKRAEQNFQLKLKKAGIKLKELEIDDRKDARDYAEKTGTKSVNRLALFIVCLVVVICVGVGYLFADGKLAALTAMQASILTLVLREGFSKLEQVCNFFFGSSHGSSEKNKLISNIKHQ